MTLDVYSVDGFFHTKLLLMEVKIKREESEEKTKEMMILVSFQFKSHEQN